MISRRKRRIGRGKKQVSKRKSRNFTTKASDIIGAYDPHGEIAISLGYKKPNKQNSMVLFQKRKRSLAALEEINRVTNPNTATSREKLNKTMIETNPQRAKMPKKLFQISSTALKSERERVTSQKSIKTNNSTAYETEYSSSKLTKNHSKVAKRTNQRETPDALEVLEESSPEDGFGQMGTNIIVKNNSF